MIHVQDENGTVARTAEELAEMTGHRRAVATCGACGVSMVVLVGDAVAAWVKMACIECGQVAKFRLDYGPD